MLHAGLDTRVGRRLDFCLLDHEASVSRSGVGGPPAAEFCWGGAARSSIACTPSCSRSGTGARYPTCSARAAASCSSFPSRGARTCSLR